LRRLAKVDPDVIRGWKADDPAATAELARLELDELGLNPRTGDFPGRKVRSEPQNSPVAR
ncbi:MAG TPA: hypothetical protein VEX89_03525, partial [Actinomycetes bacterium]|nr:hypothetical protein [Actinomycetes bacterium]